MEYYIGPSIAVVAILVALFAYIRRVELRRNNDPINLGLMGALAMRAQEQMSQEQFQEYIQEVFTLYNVPIDRMNVASRLIWASTMVDRMPLEGETKRLAASIAKQTASGFPVIS